MARASRGPRSRAMQLSRELKSAVKRLRMRPVGAVSNQCMGRRRTVCVRVAKRDLEERRERAEMKSFLNGMERETRKVMAR